MDGITQKELIEQKEQNEVIEEQELVSIEAQIEKEIIEIIKQHIEEILRLADNKKIDYITIILNYNHTYYIIEDLEIRVDKKEKRTIVIDNDEVIKQYEKALDYYDIKEIVKKTEYSIRSIVTDRAKKQFKELFNMNDNDIINVELDYPYVLIKYYDREENIVKIAKAEYSKTKERDNYNDVLEKIKLNYYENDFEFEITEESKEKIKEEIIDIVRSKIVELINKASNKEIESTQIAYRTVYYVDGIVSAIYIDDLAIVHNGIKDTLKIFENDNVIKEYSNIVLDLSQLYWEITNEELFDDISQLEYQAFENALQEFIEDFKVNEEDIIKYEYVDNKYLYIKYYDRKEDCEKEVISSKVIKYYDENYGSMQEEGEVIYFKDFTFKEY